MAVKKSDYSYPFQDLDSREAEEKLESLRTLLFAGDKPDQELVRQRVNELEEIFGSKDLLGQKLEPHFEKHVEWLQDEFPDLFGPYIGTAIKIQIRDSRKEMIDALYPIIGQLIVKYLRVEFEKISQSIDRRLEDPFSLKNLRLRLKAFFSGVKYEDLIMRDLQAPKVEEVFIINKQNGLPLGHFSIDELSHPEVVAGMLTGIKSFVEDAFEKEEQELKTLSYENYQILLFNFQTFYFAIGVDGEPHADFRTRLRDHLLDFCNKHPVWTGSEITAATKQELSEAIRDHFNGFNKETE